MQDAAKMGGLSQSCQSFSRREPRAEHVAAAATGGSQVECARDGVHMRTGNDKQSFHKIRKFWPGGDI